MTNRLYELRARAGLTQADVAKALNVHQSAISNWERGKNPPLKKYRNQLRALYRATDEELMEGFDQDEESDSPVPAGSGGAQ